MLSKIQMLPLNFNIHQKKTDNNFHVANYPADKFVKSDNSISFKGSHFILETVSKNYFRGSEPDLNDLKLLKDLGIKRIVDLIGDGGHKVNKQKANAESLNMEYINIPLRDDEPPKEEQIEQFLNIVKDKSKGPVFVHCRAGKDRTGLMTAIYSIDTMEQSFVSAYREMLKQGHDFQNISVLDKYLENYYINNYSKKRNENPNYIQESAATIREQYLRRQDSRKFFLHS